MGPINSLMGRGFFNEPMLNGLNVLSMGPIIRLLGRLIRWPKFPNWASHPLMGRLFFHRAQVPVTAPSYLYLGPSHPLMGQLFCKLGANIRLMGQNF